MPNTEKNIILRGLIKTQTSSSYEEVVCTVCSSFINISKRDVTCNLPRGTLTRCKELLYYYLPKNIIENINKMLDDFTISEIKDLIYMIYDEYNFDRSYDLVISTDLCEMAYNLMDIQHGDFVYQPYCGIGKFLVYLSYKHRNGLFFKDLVGSTANKDAALIALIATFIMSFDVNGNDCTLFVKEPLEELKYPYISAFIAPPLNMKMDEKTIPSHLFDNYKFSYRNTSEWVYIDQVIARTTKYKNNAVAIVSARALFNRADQDYRDLLVSNGLIKGIIELPLGVISNVWTKTYLLVFGNGCDTVRFICGKDFLTLKKNGHVRFDVEDVLNKFRSDNCKQAKIENLKGATSLQPSAIFLKNQSLINGIPLYKMADAFTGCQYTLGVFEKKELLSTKETGYKILTSSDIENDFVDWKSLKNIKEIDKKFEKYIIHKDDLVITSKSSKVKIAVVDIEPECKTMVTGGMIIVRPNTKLLNPIFLKIYLESEMGQNQLKSIQKGNIILTISVQDLLNIDLPTTNIELQKQMAIKYYDLLSRLVVLKEKIKHVEEKLKNLFFKSGGDE